MIGSIVASGIFSKPTMLQIGLSLVARSRDVIEKLYGYGVCSTYQETRRFKVSAAVNNRKSSAQLKVEHGLIQVVSDNFTANINTQSGIKQTNGMATFATQTQSRISKQFARLGILTLKQEELKNIKLNEAKISFFKGQKNLPMPKEFCITSIFPPKVLCEQVIVQEREKNEDFQLIKHILKSNETPDYNGYNTMNIRNNSQSLKSETKFIFTPLLDRTPSNP